MKSFACSLVLACTFTSLTWADDDASSADQAEVAKCDFVTVDGDRLDLAYEGGAEGDTIQEFIPADETLETWTRLAAIREYSDLNDPAAVAEAVVKQLEARTPPAHYELLKNSKTGDVVISFIVLPEDGSYAEFNVFQYRKKQGGGLVMYQYALRGYGDDVVPFINDMDAEARMRNVAATVKFAAEQEGEAESED